VAEPEALAAGDPDGATVGDPADGAAVPEPTIGAVPFLAVGYGALLWAIGATELAAPLEYGTGATELAAETGATGAELSIRSACVRSQASDT